MSYTVKSLLAGELGGGGGGGHVPPLDPGLTIDLTIVNLLLCFIFSVISTLLPALQTQVFSFLPQSAQECNLMTFSSDNIQINLFVLLSCFCVFLPRCIL